MTPKHFTRKEFACKCGCYISNIDDRFLARLDFAREAAGIPFKINSGCRCPEHNKAVGGVPSSSHVATETQPSYAVDINCDDSASRHRIILSLLNAGFSRIGVAKTFIHVDADPKKPANVIWTY